MGSFVDDVDFLLRLLLLLLLFDKLLRRASLAFLRTISPGSKNGAFTELCDEDEVGI